MLMIEVVAMLSFDLAATDRDLPAGVLDLRDLKRIVSRKKFQCMEMHFAQQSMGIVNSRMPHLGLPLGLTDQPAF